jgi:hypothetical protein
LPKQLVNADTKDATITEIAFEKDVPDPTGPTNDIRFVEAQPAFFRGNIFFTDLPALKALIGKVPLGAIRGNQLH